MLKAEVMETMLYGYVKWSPTVSHLAILRTAHTDCSSAESDGRGKYRDGYHIRSYEDALAKTGCENVETTVRKRRILLAGFVARMDNEMLPKYWCLGNWTGERVTPVGCLERYLSLVNFPIEANTGRWQRRSRVRGSDESTKRHSST